MNQIKTIITVSLLWTIPLYLYSQPPEKKHPVNPIGKSKFGTQLNYPGDPQLDVTYYKLDLTIQTDPELLQGIVTVQANLTSDIDEIFLDLADDLTVSTVVSRDGRQLAFSHENGQLIVHQPALVSDSDRMDLDVYYSGLPDPMNFTFHFAEHDGQPAIFTLSEPYGASTWWPCKDTPADKADSSDVVITCRSDLIPVSNGTLERVTENQNDTHTYHWKNHYPIAHYLISIAAANYDRRVQYFHYSASDSMPVEHYFYPETAENSWEEAQITVDILKVFTDLFGPYPFLKEKYGHAEMKSSFVAGMEHQTLTSMSYFSPALIAHELAHQWFGDKITCANWQNIWINEGFATYAEVLYWEQTEGKSSYDARIESLMSRAKEDDVTGSIYVENIDQSSEIFDYARTYAKGALVLHMLRKVTGDSLFFKIMKTYATEPDFAYGNATIEDFQQIAETISGMDLGFFFNQWLYGENYPIYRYGWNAIKSGDAYIMNLTIRQLKNTRPDYFTMPIDIEVKTETTDTIFTVPSVGQSSEVRIPLSQRPMAVTLDPANWMIDSARDTTMEGLTQGNPSTVYLGNNYPNPFNTETTIQLTIPYNGHLKLAVYNSQGQQIATLIDQVEGPGFKEYTWNGKTDKGDMAPSGIYFSQLEFGKIKETKKMIFIK